MFRKLRLLSFLLLAAVSSGYGQVPVLSPIVATPLSGCPPLAVSFNGSATGTGPITYNWNFGAVPPAVSQATSTTQNNAVLFNTPGVYTVTLTATNASGTSLPQTVQITVYPVPIADFTQDKTTGCYPTTVQFTDLSNPNGSPITSWTWAYGDGTLDPNTQNPAHKYLYGGSFPVTLYVKNGFGCTGSAQVKNVAQAIVLTGGVVPNFNPILNSSCQLPVGATFNNTTSGPGTLTYSWDFGDGVPWTDVTTSPNHNYTVAGAYTVRLAATSSQGCTDTLPVVVNISANGNISDFTGAGNVCINVPASFINSSSPLPNSATWDYDDGSPQASGINDQHVFTTLGPHLVTLTNTFAGCTGTVTKTVNVVAPPTTAFTATNVSSCRAPLTTQFTDQTVGATSWLWNFFDGTTSTQQNPSHTFNSIGTYQVSLTASSAAGCGTTLTKTAFINIAAPVVSITNAPAYGCAPFTYTPTISVIAVDGVATYAWNFGNGFTYNGLTPPPQTYAAGVYNVTLTITTTGGCQATATGVVRVGTVAPVTNFSALPTSQCVNQAVNFTDLSTGLRDQWLWEFGDGGTDATANPTHSYATPGVYNVSLTTYNQGCYNKLTIPAYITINPPLAGFNYSFACGNKTNYTFVDNSTGPITTWDWDFGDGSPHSFVQNPPMHVYPGGAPASYNVVLRVTNGTCSSTITRQIFTNQATTINTAINPVCNNTQITIFTSGPGNIASYVFDFGDGTTQSSGSGATNKRYTSPGDYLITVTTTDNNGCVETSAPYTMHISGPTVQFTTPTLVSCGPLVATFTDQTTPSPGSTLSSWVWDFGDGQTATGRTPAPHSYNNQGIFPVKLKVIDNNGCSDSLTKASYVTVSIQTPRFTVVDVNSCPTKDIKFTNTSTGGLGAVLYTWDFGDGTIQSFPSPSSPLHSYAGVGDYTVTLTMRDSYNCSITYTYPQRIHIDVPVASFTKSGAYSACPPFQVDFTFTGNYAQSYLWIFGGGASSISPTGSWIYSEPGDYDAYIQIVSPGGCLATSPTQRIHIDGPIGAFSYTPTAACNDIDVNFQVTTSNVISFVWNFGDGTPQDTTTAPTNFHHYGVPGEYTPFVVLKDAAGCNVTKLGLTPIEVDALTSTSFTADKTIVCDNGTVNFTNTSVLGTTFTVISNYDWNFGDGSPILSGINPNPSHTYAGPGLYNVTMNITTVGGCTGTFTVPVSVVPSPQVAINGLISQCEPAVLNYTGTELVPDANGPLTWSWNFGNGQTGTGPVQSGINYPKAGEYIVQLIATNTKGCKDTTDTSPPAHLFIYQIPSVNAGPDETICLGTPLQLNASGAATSWTWQAPVTPGATLSCYPCINPVANSPVSTYFVVDGTSPQGCAASDTIQVTVNLPVTVTVSGPDSVCLGDGAQLTASGAAIYDWTPAQGLSNPGIANPIARPDASQVGTGNSTIINYQVTGYDSKRCFSDTKSVDITAFNYPVIDLIPNATINVGSTYQISSTATTNIVSLNWDPSNTLSCANCLTPIAKPTKTTKYLLTATNEGGCATTDSIRIQVICNGANFFVPNSFSPNGDGVNDYFIVNGVGLNVIPSITIYNRWGQIVFQKSNFAPNTSATAWDGRFNGQPAPSDVYVYTIQILCDNATLIPYHGNITLIR